MHVQDREGTARRKRVLDPGPGVGKGSRRQAYSLREGGPTALAVGCRRHKKLLVGHNFVQQIQVHFSGPEGQHIPSRWCQPPDEMDVVSEGLEGRDNRLYRPLQASEAMFVLVSGALRHRLGLCQPFGLSCV